MKNKLLMAIAAGSLCAPMLGHATPISDLFGDIDCFGTGFACADGAFGAGDSGAFTTFTSAMTPDGTAPATDLWALGDSQSWVHTIALTGSETVGMLEFRTYAMSDMRGPYDVFVNGMLAGTTTIIDTGEVWTSQQIETHTFSFSAAWLISGMNTIDVIKVAGAGDSWALDYSLLSANGTGVAEPATLALLGAGLLGFGLLRRKHLQP